MKKINGSNNKDRVICVSESNPTQIRIKTNNKYKSNGYIKTVLTGNHAFYYQPANTSARTYLFSTKQYNSSIADLFTAKWVLINDTAFSKAYSISLGELYKLHNYRHNYVVNKIVDRISVMIDTVIRYELDIPTKAFSERNDNNLRFAKGSGKRNYDRHYDKAARFIYEDYELAA